MTDSSEIVLVPIKKFGSAKTRLRGALDSSSIETLSRKLAHNVITAALPRRCIVLCDNNEVAAFAEEAGAEVFVTHVLGLNEAVRDGFDRVRSSCGRVVIAHADLARPDGLGTMSFGEGVTIFTDRHQLGTNVLVVPTSCDFQFAYGDASALRHREESERLGLEITVVLDSDWGLDIDDPEDLALLEK